MDGKGHAENVSYYVRDALGREVARYDNTNNDRFSNGNENKTGSSHQITLNGKTVTVEGIDRITKNTFNAYNKAEKPKSITRVKRAMISLLISQNVFTTVVISLNLTFQK